MRRSLSLLALALAFVTSSLAAQGARTISPGMNRQQVIAALGKPFKLSEADGYTYIFYQNQCTRACGMNDIVILRADSVVDAIFRSPERHYTGTSSSPEAIPARVASHGKAAATPSKPLTVKTAPKKAPTPNTKMKPGPPNDVKPSLPVNPPKLKPTP